MSITVNLRECILFTFLILLNACLYYKKCFTFIFSKIIIHNLVLTYKIYWLKHRQTLLSVIKFVCLENKNIFFIKQVSTKYYYRHLKKIFVFNKTRQKSNHTFRLLLSTLLIFALAGQTNVI